MKKKTENRLKFEKKEISATMENSRFVETAKALAGETIRDILVGKN